MGWLNNRRSRGSEAGREGAAPEARLEAMVSGRVQGVGFRWWTRGIAQDQGLLGFAENLPDGRVRIVAEGSRSGVEELWNALNSGDTAGKVSDVERSDPAPTGEFDRFDVK